MSHLLQVSQRLPHAVEQVFDFFSRAENLAAITPPSLGFEILTPLPVDMRAGARIDYRIRLHGMPMKWRTRIAEWNPPLGFVDVQERGPYALWEHSHRFRSDGPDATVMDDEVRYELPFGALGSLALPLVRRQLRGIFEYRRAAVEGLFRDKYGSR
ncbi:MAG: SRPBCC family protein [Gemmatimonadetes bacterium]|nr:SRPBCC family protein [Gemmatimonadota bacterium]